MHLKSEILYESFFEIANLGVPLVLHLPEPKPIHTMTSYSRALLFFHHIKNKNKRLYIREHAQDLNVTGICKTGFPGVLVVQGETTELKRYVADVKACNIFMLTCC